MLKPVTCLLLTACGVLATGRALAEELSAADLAWIDKCIDDRKVEQQDPTKLRQYCTCMQGSSMTTSLSRLPSSSTRIRRRMRRVWRRQVCCIPSLLLPSQRLALLDKYDVLAREMAWVR
jgi:hypothetical protein